MWWFDTESSPGWIDYLGLLLTVVGFIIAFLQLSKTRSAAVAARTASERSLGEAQKLLSQRSLLFLIPQVQAVVEDLDYSISSNDIQVSRRALVRFTHISGEMRALISEMEFVDQSLGERLSDAAKSAAQAKGRLMTGSRPDVAATVKTANRLINGLSVELTEVAAALRNKVEGTSNV